MTAGPEPKITPRNEPIIANLVNRHPFKNPRMRIFKWDQPIICPSRRKLQSTSVEDPPRAKTGMNTV